MKHTLRQHLVMLGGALAATIFTSGSAVAEGELHEIDMLNVDTDDRQQWMMFKPGVLRVVRADRP